MTMRLTVFDERQALIMQRKRAIIAMTRSDRHQTSLEGLFQMAGYLDAYEGHEWYTRFSIWFVKHVVYWLATHRVHWTEADVQQSMAQGKALADMEEEDDPTDPGYLYEYETIRC